MDTAPVEPSAAHSAVHAAALAVRDAAFATALAEHAEHTAALAERDDSHAAALAERDDDAALAAQRSELAAARAQLEARPAEEAAMRAVLGEGEGVRAAALLHACRAGSMLSARERELGRPLAPALDDCFATSRSRALPTSPRRPAASIASRGRATSSCAGCSSRRATARSR